MRIAIQSVAAGLVLATLCALPVRAGRIDDFGVAVSKPLFIDRDRNGISDTWEKHYLGAEGRNPTNDTDGDGINDRLEYLAGTDPTRANSRTAVTNVNLVTETGGSIALAWQADGTNNAEAVNPFQIAGDRIIRTFRVLRAAADGSGRQVLFATNELVDVGTYVDADAITGTRTNFLYFVDMEFGGVTNRLMEQAVFVQPRQTNTRYLICLPVDYGSETDNNLTGKMGRDLARGLSTGDVIRIMTGAMFSSYWLASTNPVCWNIGTGPDDNFGTAPATPLTPGQGVEVTRAGATAGRSNAVFLARAVSEVNQNIPTYALAGAGGNSGFSLFGWPLGESVQIAGDNLGLVAAGAAPGTIPATDPSGTNRWGDRILLWSNDTWVGRYFLRFSTVPAYSNVWWDYAVNQPASFTMTPGEGYMYWHTTGNIYRITSSTIYWKPTMP